MPEGQLIAPGFLDGHIHIESSMMTPIEYAKAVIPHGTVGIYYDPHEVCNVLGLKGVDLMAEEAEKTPLKAMLTTPSAFRLFRDLRIPARRSPPRILPRK